MGCIHRLKVEPNSDAERYFMGLLAEVGVKPKAVMCRLGDIFGTPYNEYIFSDGLYKLIQNKLTYGKVEES